MLFAAIPPMFKRTFLGAALVATVFAAPASAMEFARHPLPELGPNAIGLSLTGEINRGDGDRFRQFVERLPTTDHTIVVALDSGGGSINEALYIAHIIHQSGATTMVSDHSVCASACFLIFASGQQRAVGAAGQIGVHSSSVNGAEDQSTLAYTTELARQAKAAGVPDAVIGKMVATPPGQIAWLENADLAAMKVKIIPSQPPAPSTAPVPAPQPTTAAPHATAPDPSSAYTAGLADRAHIETWLRTLEGSFQSGAAYWMSVRSTAQRNGACQPGGQTSADDFTKGCLAAKQLMDPMDYRRTHEPEYKAGWNSYTDPDASTPPQPVASTAPASNQPVSAPDDPATKAFMDGHADRLAFENWIQGLSGQTKEGALYWASVRSTSKAATGCMGPGYTGTPEQQAWANGCGMAKTKLAPLDYRRNNEPDYKAGWISASRAIAGPQTRNS